MQHCGSDFEHCPGPVEVLDQVARLFGVLGNLPVVDVGTEDAEALLGEQIARRTDGFV